MTSIQRFAQITPAFDPEATSVLGQAFDMACALLGRTPQPTAVREAIAKMSLATPIEQRLRRASAKAAASCGRRSKASLPLPVSTSTNTRTSSKPSAWANRESASCCAWMPSPERPCVAVETRTYPMSGLTVIGASCSSLYKTYRLILILYNAQNAHG